MDIRRAALVGLGVVTLGLGVAVVGALSLGIVEQPRTHVVVKGDTLFEIARAQGVPVWYVKWPPTVRSVGPSCQVLKPKLFQMSDRS